MTNLQTLIFDTDNKKIKLYSGIAERSEIIIEFEEIPTVMVAEGYYQVMQKTSNGRTIPVLRLPISNTNMFIINK
jgi:hypothetical protein